MFAIHCWSESFTASTVYSLLVFECDITQLNSVYSVSDGAECMPAVQAEWQRWRVLRGQRHWRGVSSREWNNSWKHSRWYHHYCHHEHLHYTPLKLPGAIWCYINSAYYCNSIFSPLVAFFAKGIKKLRSKNELWLNFHVARIWQVIVQKNSVEMLHPHPATLEQVNGLCSLANDLLD